MEDRNICSQGHVVEPRRLQCNSGHQLGISLACPLEDCTFKTKAVALDFKDLVRSEIDQHMLDYHKDVKEAMRQVCFLGHAISTPDGTCVAGHAKGISLKCQVEHCIFATKPVPIGFMGIANKRIERHAVASHPSIKTGNMVTAEQSEHSENSNSEEVINNGDMLKCKDAINEISKDDLPLNEELKVNKKHDKRTCPVCNKIFSSVGNMKAHVRSHHDAVGRFECENCEKTFSSKVGLQYHIKRTHSNGLEVSCETCDDKFSDFEKYCMHRKTHLSIHHQLEHKCTECNKIIRGKKNLNVHMKEVHSLEKRYNLEKVTVLIYPHNCHQCGAVFKRKSHLKNHVQGIHNGRKFACNLCGKEFKSKSNMTRHIKSSHK